MLLTALSMATFAHQPVQPQRRRIALLHGTAGSAKTLSIQLGPLLPKLQEIWDVTFVEGPKLCKEDNASPNLLTGFSTDASSSSETKYARIGNVTTANVVKSPWHWVEKNREQFPCLHD